MIYINNKQLLSFSIRVLQSYIELLLNYYNKFDITFLQTSQNAKYCAINYEASFGTLKNIFPKERTLRVITKLTDLQ